LDTVVHSEYAVLNRAEQEKELLLTLSRTQFAALDTANAQYSANRNIVEKLRFDYNNLIGQQSVAEDEIKRLCAEQTACSERISALKKFRADKGAEAGVLDEKCDELEDKANEVYIKVTETRKDIESVQLMIDNINARVADLDADKNSQVARIDELNSKRDNIDNIKAENLSEYKALEAELESLNEQRREVESGSDEFERELNVIREKTKEKNASRQAFYEAMIRNENKYNHFSSSFFIFLNLGTISFNCCGILSFNCCGVNSFN
jgi:chromosome segregation ATPase